MGNHNRHFSGDKYAFSGIWSPSTSAANFCEEDYAVTLYVAEFINSLSNLAYIYFAFKYANAGPKRSWKDRFDPMSLSLILVGIGSFAFHATLRQGAQYCDDLAMFTLAGSLIHKLYTAGPSPVVQSTATTIIVSGIVVLSAIYVSSGDLVLHTASFAGLLTLIWPRTIYLIYFQSRTKTEQARLIRRFGKAVVVLVVAFAIWNVDLEFCLGLRRLRHGLGLPLAWVLELHGWWHILTAIGADEYMQLSRELCPL